MQQLTNHLTTNSRSYGQPSNSFDDIDSSTIIDTDQSCAIKKQHVKILVVEDGVLNQKMLRLFLQEQGYDCDVADSGEEAITLVSEHDYAAILMDIGLPGIDGLETTKQIRALEQDNNKHVPIIACTANGWEYKAQCLAAGMDDFSVKPFEFESLSCALKNWLKS